MRIRHIVLTAAVTLAVCLSAGIVAGQKSDQADLALKAAIKAETVDGDLRGAIEQYRKIAALAGAGRAAVATALVRMGGCYEKLGEAEAAEARKAYEQVVREYGDQAAAAAEARAKLAALAGLSASPRGATLAVRRVLANAEVSGRVSADGRILSFTAWDSGGSVAIRELATGRIKVLPAPAGGGYAEPSVPSPDGKSVAFAWSGDHGRELHVVGTDGSAPRVLRASGDGVMHAVPAAWSPDGDQLLAVFEKTDGSQDMMLVAVADGSAKLLKAVGKDLSPGGEFSPDGQAIAWATKEGLSLFDLRAGTESLLIPDVTKHSVLGWTADGRHILFSSERAGSDDAWLLTVAGGKAQGEPTLVRKNWGNRSLGLTRSGAFYYAVFNNVFEVRVAELDPKGQGPVSSPQPAFRRGNTTAPDWSPDGHWLAATDGRMPGRAVIVRSMDTGEERELPVGEWAIGPGSLRWTPDGKAVVVPASGPGKGNNLIRIDVQTGQVSVLMPLPALGGWPRFGLTRDGRELFYLRPGAGLVARDLTSGLEREIIREPEFYWGAPSPDGQKVAIAVNSDKSWALLVKPAAGGELRELVRIDRAVDYPFLGSPGWTEDSRSIVFLLLVRGQKQQWNLMRVPVEGGEPQRIGQVSAHRLLGVRRHPDGRRVAISDVKVDLEIWVMENFLPPSKS